MEHSTDPFVEVHDCTLLYEVLRNRFPSSAGVYNVILMMERYSNLGIRAFVLNEFLNGTISEDSWIVTICQREDFGAEICASVPRSPIITPFIKSAFKTSPIFDWTKQYSLAAIDQEISTLFFELSLKDYSNPISCRPCYLFIMDEPWNATDADINFNMERHIGNDKLEFEVKSQTESTGTKFVEEHWKFAKEGTKEYITRVLRDCPSSGVYINGSLVSGAILPTRGILAMLFTRAEYRGRGYAKICVKNLFKVAASQGFIPVSTVEIHNEASVAFHKSLGMEISHKVSYMEYIH